MKPSFRPARGRSYIAFYKPFEVLCQFSEEKESGEEKKTTLAAFDFPASVYPVGRLDYDSEGLLLLSDDGRMTRELFEGREHPRTYLVQVERVPEAAQLLQLEKGVLLQGVKTRPAKVKLLTDEPQIEERCKPIRFRKSVPTAWLELTLWEGKNRQVRRMTAHVGHPTLRLLRVSIGQLRLSDLGLKCGQWRSLSPEEVLKIFA
ncbi:MAG TPA: pseudouridine synthase [Candidatus Obscuribacter sp.]|nr:pseudouridine synthase [Candidatus Obscuribacter sp.]HMW89466.1 pseudouridine synthase [Candidatus Obscuribacter sp.]HMX44553.1 pseudouridine synthase [Candidatus Obscuribacter sp.]HMY01985.1 pseudouridine synthase [Candidatus Obscuribacter sp.]HMY52788.1 pseudouridine synthase [Candidatus Obscuribacter sp.]